MYEHTRPRSTTTRVPVYFWTFAMDFSLNPFNFMIQVYVYVYNITFSLNVSKIDARKCRRGNDVLCCRQYSHNKVGTCIFVTVSSNAAKYISYKDLMIFKAKRNILGVLFDAFVKRQTSAPSSPPGGVILGRRVKVARFAIYKLLARGECMIDMNSGGIVNVLWADVQTGRRTRAERLNVYSQVILPEGILTLRLLNL